MPPGVFSIPEPEHWGDYDLRHEYDYENYLDLELWKEAGLTEPEEYEVFYDRKEEEAKRIPFLRKKRAITTTQQREVHFAISINGLHCPLSDQTSSVGRRLTRLRLSYPFGECQC